jgi:hypothetical protein
MGTGALSVFLASGVIYAKSSGRQLSTGSVPSIAHPPWLKHIGTEARTESPDPAAEVQTWRRSRLRRRITKGDTSQKTVASRVDCVAASWFPAPWWMMELYPIPVHLEQTTEKLGSATRLLRPHITRSCAQGKRRPVRNSLYSASVGSWIVAGSNAALTSRKR